MWCSMLEIGGITKPTCEKWGAAEGTSCSHCKGVALVEYPEPVPQCGCGNPGNHPAMCSYRKAFFENEREASEQEKIYVRGMLQGLSKSKAAGLVGEKASALDTPASRKFLAVTLHAAGLTDELVAEKIKDGLDAKMSIKLRNSDGAEALAEVEDNTNQFRYTELAVKIKGGIAEKGQFNVQGDLTIVNHFSRNEPEGVIDVTPKEATG